MRERLTVADLHYKESLDMIKNKIEDMHYRQALDIISNNGCFKEWQLSCYNCLFGDAEINSVDDPEYCNPKKNLEKAKQFVKTYEQGWRYRTIQRDDLKNEVNREDKMKITRTGNRTSFNDVQINTHGCKIKT